MMEANFELEIFEDGESIIKRRTHNCVTEVGCDLARRNLMEGGTARQLGWVHLGQSNSKREDPGATALDKDLIQSRWSGIRVVEAGLDCILQIKEEEHVGVTLNAAGIFTGERADSPMYAHAVFPEVTKSDNHFLVVTWQLRWRPKYVY